MAKQLVAKTPLMGTFLSAEEAEELLEVETGAGWPLAPVTIRERMELLEHMEAQQEALAAKLAEAVNDAETETADVPETSAALVQSQAQEAAFVVWLSVRRTAPGLTLEERQAGDWNTSPALIEEILVEVAARRDSNDLLAYAMQLGQQVRLLRGLPMEGKAEGGLATPESEPLKSSETAENTEMS